MTVPIDLAAVSVQRIEAAVMRAVRSYHHGQEAIVRADFAVEVAATLRRMRPPATETGDRAVGYMAGLEAAVDVILRLAGIPFTREHLEEATRG